MTEKKPSQHVEAWQQIWNRELSKPIQTDKLKRDLSTIGFSNIIPTVLKVGWIDLGNECGLTSCAGCGEDAICFLFPLETPDTSTRAGTPIVCSGPMSSNEASGFLHRILQRLVRPSGDRTRMQKTRMGEGTDQLVLELPKRECPYSFYYQDIDVDELYDEEAAGELEWS